MVQSWFVGHTRRGWQQKSERSAARLAWKHDAAVPSGALRPTDDAERYASGGRRGVVHTVASVPHLPSGAPRLLRVLCWRVCVCVLTPRRFKKQVKTSESGQAARAIFHLLCCCWSSFAILTICSNRSNPGVCSRHVAHENPSLTPLLTYSLPAHLPRPSSSLFFHPTPSRFLFPSPRFFLLCLTLLCLSLSFLFFSPPRPRQPHVACLFLLFATMDAVNAAPSSAAHERHIFILVPSLLLCFWGVFFPSLTATDHLVRTIRAASSITANRRDVAFPSDFILFLRRLKHVYVYIYISN